MYRLCALLVLMTLGCSKEEQSSPCSNEINLGVFPSKELVPYHDFLVLFFENQQGDERLVSVNHPSQLLFFNVRKVDILEDSDCAEENGTNRYRWIVDRRNTLLSFVLNGSSEEILLREEYEVDPNHDNHGYSLEFRHNSLNGQFEGEPFLRLRDADLATPAAIGSDYEFYELYENSGFEFNEVFTQTGETDLAVKRIFYHATKGLVGFIDSNDVVWKLRE